MSRADGNCDIPLQNTIYRRKKSALLNLENDYKKKGVMFVIMNTNVQRDKFVLKELKYVTHYSCKSNNFNVQPTLINGKKQMK